MLQGRAHPERSGFDGPWTKNPLKFDNSYFVYDINEGLTWLTNFFMNLYYLIYIFNNIIRIC